MGKYRALCVFTIREKAKMWKNKEINKDQVFEMPDQYFEKYSECVEKINSENKVFVPGVGMVEQIDPTELLKGEMKEQEVDAYAEGEINWLEGDYYDSWDKVKGHLKSILGHHKTYDKKDKNVPKMKKIFLAHSKDTLIGKPQLAVQTQVQIPLIKEMVSDDKEDDKLDLYKYMIFDEKVDGRTKGYQKDSFSIDFRLYKLVDKQDKEFFILSHEILPNCSCEFKGMVVEMEYTGEIKKNFGIKQLSRMFIMKECIPSVNILSKEAIVKFTKERGIDETEWRNFLDIHPSGNFNRFIPEVNSLRDAFVLSGKRDGYPLHLRIMGCPGTGKSKGHLETLDFKFNEAGNILEGGNSRIKMLTPSFKEKPANLGYLAKCERIATIDESGKMCEFEMNKHQTQVQNIFGDCNGLLDHIDRLVGSGNDNASKVQATAKVIDVSNPVSSKPTIYAHVGLIDPTYLSRNLNWVQDDDEHSWLLDGNMVERISPHTDTNIYIVDLRINKTKNTLIFLYVRGNREYGYESKFHTREEFLTLFDTCNSFTCEVDEAIVKRIHQETILLARPPMKESVWKPRGDHHIYLLIDGLVKHRCLFKDYDATFTPKQEDYDLAERILVRMVKSWDTNLSPKEDIR